MSKTYFSSLTFHLFSNTFSKCKLYIQAPITIPICYSRHLLYNYWLERVSPFLNDRKAITLPVIYDSCRQERRSHTYIDHATVRIHNLQLAKCCQVPCYRSGLCRIQLPLHAAMRSSCIASSYITDYGMPFRISFSFLVPYVYFRSE